MDLRTKLSVIYSDGVTESNYSAEAQDFRRDPFTLTMMPTDFIYVGFKKVFNALYFQIQTPNEVVSSLSVEYYSESGWSSLDVSEETKAFIRSGFMTWERPQDAAPLTVAGQELCWIRIAANDELDPVVFQGINIVFSDDNAISEEVPALVDACFFQQGQNSHILSHIAAKNYIMSRLRSLGYIKYSADGEQNINEWDVLDVYELRQAATYYVISQIYFNLSDTPDDQYWAKYKEYDKKFEESFGLGRLRIDSNDDGQVNLSEKRPIKSIRWFR